MILAVRVLALLILWTSFKDAMGFAFLVMSEHWGEYSSTGFVFSSLLPIGVKAAVSIVLLFKSASVLSLLGANEITESEHLSYAVAFGFSVLVGVYFLVMGLTLSISKYAIALIQLNSMRVPGGRMFSGSLYDWDWQGFLFGSVQAILGLAVILVAYFYNKNRRRIERD